VSAAADSAHGPASDDDIAYGSIVALSFCLGAGLLASAGVFPLHWLPGQQVLLLLCLAGLPLATVWSTVKLGRLVGLPAGDFARRMLLARLAAVALLLVVLPAAESQLLERGTDLGSMRFLGPVLASLALCLLTTEVAATHVRAWSLLHAQVWEIDETSRRAANDAKRDQILMVIRRAWAAGAVALALASLADARLTTGDALQVWLGLLAFAVYAALGLVLISTAARARMLTYWHLSGIAVPEQVTPEWNRLSLTTVLLTVLVSVLLLLLHVLDLAHALLNWTLGRVLAPLALWFQHLFNPPPPPIVRHGGPAPEGGTSAGFHRAVAQPHPTASSGFWRAIGALLRALADLFRALAGQWPLLLGLLCTLIIVYAYRATLRKGGATGVWRAMLAVFLRDLQALRALLWTSTRILAGRALAAMVSTGTSTARRIVPRRGPAVDKMPPRQAVIAIYLTALAVMARRGQARRPGETPNEYAQEVAGRMPSGRDELEQLTSAFVAARYSGQPVQQADVSRMQALWASLRRAIRRRS
jgi:hypothetical protein